MLATRTSVDSKVKYCEVAIYFAEDGKLADWKVREFDQKAARGIKQKSEWTIRDCPEESVAQYPESLRSVIEYLYTTQPKTPLEVLYFLKAKVAEKKITMANKDSFGDVRLYLLPIPKEATLDQLITLILKKNKTYTKSEEIHEVFDKIMHRFPGLPLTQQKTEILNNFLNFKIAQNGKIFSRSQFVEAWAKEYYRNNQINPFETLSKQRRTGCLAFFNPEKTDSMAFFHKFLRGERISPSLQNWLDLKPIESVENTLRL